MHANLNKLIKTAPIIAPYAIQSAPLGEAVANGLKTQKQGFGRFFTFVNTATSGMATALTTPIWLTKDLATMCLAAPLACLPKSLLGKKIGVAAGTARRLFMQSLLSSGVDLISPLVALGLSAYSATSFPTKLNGRLPTFASSIKALSNEEKAQFERFANHIGGADKAVQLLSWIQNHPELPMKLVEEFAELKPLAQYIPLGAAALLDAHDVMSSEEKLKVLVQNIEAISTAPFIGLAMAALKKHQSLCGRLSNIDSRLSFGATALSAPAHMLKNIFNITLALPFAILAKATKGNKFKNGAAFLKSQRSELKLNTQCLGIGLVSSLSPAYGSSRVSKKVSAITPKSFINLAKQLLADLQNADLKGLIKATKELTALDSQDAILDYMLPKVLSTMQKHPDMFANLKELIAIFPALAKHIPAGLLENSDVLLPLLAKIAGNNQDLIKEGLQLLTNGNNPAEGFKRMMQNNPEIKEKIINTLIESPEAITAAVNLLAATPALMEAVPESAQKLIPTLVPIVPQLAKIAKENPALIQQGIKLSVEGNNAAEIVAKMANELPAVKDAAINVIKTNPELASHFTQVYKAHPQILASLPKEFQDLLR